MASIAGIWYRVAQSWRRSGTAIKILVILDVLAVLLIIGFFIAISASITQPMRANVETDLRHHIGTLYTIFAWEGLYLRAEARTLTGLEGVDEALRARDVQYLGRLMATIQNTHDLDAIYVVTSNGDVLLGSAPYGPDPAAVANLNLVREGLAGKSLDRFFVADDKVWLAGVAAHVGSGGRIDAVFLAIRELDHDYLKGLSATLGLDVVLTDGQLVVSSLSPDDQNRLLTTRWLSDSLSTEEPRLQDVRIGNAPYRLLMAPLSPTDSPSLVAGVLQPTRLIEDAIRQIIGRVTVLGILLITVPFVLIQFLIRAVFKPLESLMRATESIATGNLDRPVQAQGTVEVQALGISFDQMRIRLQKYLEEQRRWNQELDAQVRARTRELEATRAFQQSIIDGVAEPILVIGTDYRVKMMNRAAREFSGDVSASESPRCYQISHHHEVPCSGERPCPMEAVRESGRPITVVHEHYSVNGKWRFVEIVASPLWGEDGAFQGIIECMRDITERKQAEETLQQYTERLRALTAQLIEAAEAERQRVARELHDETSQALANLVVTLGTVARLTADGKTRRHLEQVKELAVDTLEGVKRIVLDLRPRLLDDYGLLPAIRWYAEERLGQVGVDVIVEVQGMEMRLPPYAETGVFRVIQEAVNNIARHAHSTHARIRLTWEPNQLAVEIEDNGRGFDAQTAMSGVRRDQCLGLLGMQERVALMGGALAMDSVPGSGTRILIRVPLPQTVEANVQDQRVVSG